MPIDRKGTKLHPGDVVCIPCLVTGVDQHPDFINVALETVEPAFPGNVKTQLLMNARQCELLQPLGHSDPDMSVRQAIDGEES